MCIVNENGQVVKRRTIRSGWQTLLGECRRITEPFAVCFEASCGYGYLYDALCTIAQNVVVGHPGHLRLISRSKRKNDRIDAEKLAKLLYLDMVPAAHVPSFEVRQWRGMIEYRQRLVAKRVRCKNTLRALLRSQGIQMPRGLWTRKGLAWLGSVELRGSLSALRREMLLEELTTLDRQVARVTKQLDTIARKDPGVIVLRTIPGVGPRTAEAVVAYVDDPNRFRRTRQAGAYFGLVPCQDASAGTNRLGHITRQGPATARKLLVEAAWQVIRRCPRTRERFERIAGDNRDRRKIAVVAVAHYLVRCMVSMLQSGEAWRPAA
jgi:transposase